MKILFFAHDGKLGDAIVHTAFVDAALQLDPAVELYALVSGLAETFWKMDPRIRKTWRYENPPLGEALRTSLALRREHFDYIVTWKERFRSEKTKLMLWLAAPARGILHEEGKLPGQVVHAVRKCQVSLRMIYGDRASAIAPRYRLGIEPDGRFDAVFPPDAEVILLNMFGSDPARTIGMGEAAAILDGLTAQAPAALLSLSCTRQSEPVARQVAAGRDNCRVVNTDGDLRGLISLCARAALIISPDTSLVHLASALDRPVVCIFQDDGIKSVEWAPLSTRSASVISTDRGSIRGFSVASVLDHAARLRAP